MKYRRFVYASRNFSANELRNILADVLPLVVTNPEEFMQSVRAGKHLPEWQIVTWILRKVSKASLSRIGHLMNRDHSTILHHVRAVEDRLTRSDHRDAMAPILRAVYREHRKRQGKPVAKFASRPQAIIRKQKVQLLAKEATELAPTEVAWHDKDYYGTPSQFFKQQNDRFAKAMRQGLAREAKERGKP